MGVEDNIKKIFKKSWSVFSNNIATLILGCLVAFLLMIFIITIPPLIYGIYYMCSQAAKGKKIQVSDVFKGFNYFFTSWGLLLLIAISVGLGLIFLIIPGILLMIVWQYAFAVSIIENRGVIDSLGRSYRIAKTHFSFSTVFWILLMVISAVGSMTRVGMLISFPFTTLATCVAVQILSKGVKKK